MLSNDESIILLLLLIKIPKPFMKSHSWPNEKLAQLTRPGYSVEQLAWGVYPWGGGYSGLGFFRAMA